MSSPANTIYRKPRLVVTSASGSQSTDYVDVEELARAFGRLFQSERFERRYGLNGFRQCLERFDRGRVLRYEWLERFAGPPLTERQHHEDRPPHLHWREYEVFGVHGEALPIDFIEGLSKRLGSGTRRWWWGLPYCGYGPVPGVRKRRGRRYFRSMGTLNERRLNAMTIVEEGEVPARACRCGHHLPSSWDDFNRCPQRNWKEQTKGRKSWDR